MLQRVPLCSLLKVAISVVHNAQLQRNLTAGYVREENAIIVLWWENSLVEWDYIAELLYDELI